MMNCDHARELIDLHALGALEAHDAADLEAHLVACVDCRRLADQANATAAELTFALAAASPHRPPPDLRSRVLGSVTAGPDAVARSETTAAPDAPPFLASSEQPRPPGLSLGRRTQPIWLNPRSLVAAAAVALLIVSLAWSVRLSQALDRERSVRERMANLFSQQQEIVLEVLDAPDGGKELLRPLAADSNAYGKLYTRPDMPYAVVMANRLPPPPDGQTYQAWLTVGDRVVFAGNLSLNDDGFGLLVHQAPMPGPVYDAVEISLQPPDSSQPGGQLVLRWPSAP